MRQLVTSLALILTSGVGFACKSDDEPPQTAADATAAQVLTITATDYALEAPDTVSAGFSIVRIVNHGEEVHGATLVRLEEDKTLPDYLEAYGEANRARSARPGWARFLGGTLSLIPPRGEGTVTLELEPGNYAWVCFVPGPDGTVHLLGHKQAHGFVVRPRDGDAAPPSAPEPTVFLRMLDFDYKLGAPLNAGRNVIRVVNDGVEPHHVLMFKLDSARTMEDFHAWLENLMQGEAPATFVGAMGEMSTGAEGYLEVDLPAGDYVLICLVAGRDEVPHFAKGMIQHIRVE